MNSRKLSATLLINVETFMVAGALDRSDRQLSRPLIHTLSFRQMWLLNASDVFG